MNFYSPPPGLWWRHVVRLNRACGRDLDCIEPGVCYHGGRAEGCTTWFERARGWNRPGIWSGGVDDPVVRVGWHKGNRSTNQGISREPPLPTNKFSPRSNLHQAPFRPSFPSTSHFLPLCHPLGVARPRFQGMEVRSASLHIDCGEKHRAPASVLVLDLRCCPFSALERLWRNREPYSHRQYNTRSPCLG